MFDNTQSFLLVLLAAALAPIVAGLVSARFKSLILPVVVVELIFGVVIGPQGLGVAYVDDVLNAFSQLGLGFLFFFAGYEIRIAGSLGMDVILGAFAAGMIMRLIVGDGDFGVFDSKMEAVGFGFLIPFFFVISGMTLDINSLFASTRGMVLLPVFFVLMFVVRGVPEFAFYRRVVPRDQIPPLALLASTQLPLVVAITAIGLDNGNMRSSTAAALVTAAVLTVLIFPSVALKTLGRVDPQPKREPAA